MEVIDGLKTFLKIVMYAKNKPTVFLFGIKNFHKGDSDHARRRNKQTNQNIKDFSVFNVDFSDVFILLVDLKPKVVWDDDNRQ